MTHRILDCVVCDVWIEKWETDGFHYTSDDAGPYCDKCWLFIERIDDLAKRVAELEKPPVKTQLKRGNVYDLGARGRAGRGSKNICPHRPQYRNCWCGS